MICETDEIIPQQATQRTLAHVIEATHIQRIQLTTRISEYFQTLLPTNENSTTATIISSLQPPLIPRRPPRASRTRRLITRSVPATWTSQVQTSCSSTPNPRTESTVPPFQSLPSTLIPSQVRPILVSTHNEQNDEVVTLEPVPEAINPHVVAPLTTEERLRLAQTLWAERFPASRTDVIPISGGARPIVLSVENQRENAAWGDKLQPKPVDVTRVYAMNVNGLRLDERGGQFDELCKVLREVKADIFCGQEHNLDSDKTEVRQILYPTARHHWHRSRIIFGTTPIPFSNQYKPGGTFMVTCGDTTGRVLEQTSDKWGRWVRQVHQGQGTMIISIYSAYQVVDKAIKVGSVTAAAQQQALLQTARDTILDPRQAFRRDITDDISNQIAKGHEILLLGDFNEVFMSDEEGMIKVANTCGLLDLMSIRHSSTPPATYARGRSRLDYALATPHVAHAMTRSGYESFQAKDFQTDHRPYYLDFDTSLLYGTETQQLGKPSKRIIYSNNVKQTTAYIKKKYDMLLHHDAFTRGDRLEAPGDRHAYAERLDKDVVHASLSAEKQLKHFGDPAWSIALDKARKTVLRLSKCLTMARTGLNLMESVQTVELADWDEPFDIPLTVRDCTTRLREARKEADFIARNSFSRRDDERRDHIKALNMSPFQHDKDHAKRLRFMQKAEDVKRLFRKLEAIQTTDPRHGVTRIEIPLHPNIDPKVCDEWQQIEVPTEVMHHLQQRNRKHFGQANGSPFTVSPLVDHLGFCGDGPQSTSILKGDYDTTGYSDSVAMLIQHLKQSSEMAALPVRASISEQEYAAKLRVWRESTTTSPSGLHLGHYKSLIARHSYSDLPPDADDDLIQKKATWDHMQGCLLRLHVQQMNYALERGYAYTRWCTVYNTMLFKDPDNVRIDRMRVLHIYEADYNLMLGVKWREALYQAEAFLELNDGQYGSRPRRNAFDPVFIEELQFEISRATRKMLVQTNYDATSCYDRIIQNLAMLVSQKFGVHPSVTKSNASTLEKAEFRIRTELGVSDTGYKHTLPDFPIYGTGQGSGNSPQIYCFLSSLMFDCYEKLNSPAHYCNPDRTQMFHIAMIGFVDDSNGQTNDFMSPENDATLPKTLFQLRHNAQTWANILGASGGALELSKCSCHLLSWSFTAKGDPILASVAPILPEPLIVTDPLTKAAQALTFLSPYTAHKTLGHYKEPAGNQLEQFSQLHKKSDKKTRFLLKCSLTPVEAWTYYYASYLPSIGYPLACSSLTYMQLDRVQRTAMQIIIARCGYNRNTKREIIYGPMMYGGANFRHLYMQQGVGQLTMFLRHWRQPNTVTGKLLKCAVAWTQMTAGTSYSIFQRVMEDLPHLEAKWMTSMRTFMSEINATMELDYTGVPPLQRQKDSYIMDWILESNHFTKLETRRLNYCRLYLQAITISDLSDATGTHLDPAKLYGTMSSQSSITTLITINQDRPSEVEWKLWRKANLLWSNAQGELTTYLGQWLHPRSSQRQQHFAYLCRWNRLYVRIGKDQYQMCTPTGIPRDFRFHPRLRIYSQLRNTAHPVHVKMSPTNPDNWRMDTVRSVNHVSPSIQPAVSFESFVDKLEPWEIDLLRMVTMSLDPNAVIVALEHGFRAASDGSVRFLKHGSFGWALSTDQGIQVAVGQGPARGPRPSSYRAEAYGLLSILRFFIRLAEYTGKHEPWSGILVTDSQSVLKTLAGGDIKFNAVDEPVLIDGKKVVLDVLCPDWDVLIEIQHALAQLPSIRLKFVKGHQDATTPYAQLSLLARLNVDADAQAGMFQDAHGQERPIVLLTPRTGVLIHLYEGTVTANYSSQLRHAYCGPPLLEAIRLRNNWTASTLESINWESHGGALRKQQQRGRHYVKHVHELLPTQAQKNKFDKGNRTCPCCASLHEDRDHIMRCPHPSRRPWREKFLDSMKAVCVKHHTYDPLKYLLLAAVTSWIYPNADQLHTVPLCDDYDEELHPLIRSQTLIGWGQLFNGRFSKQWSQLQDTHLYMIRDHLPVKNRTGHKWQVVIITEIWEHWFDLWKLRNTDVYGNDAATRSLAEKREAARALAMIYDQREHMEPCMQEKLYDTVQVHMEKSTPWAIKNWIRIRGPEFAASVKEVRKKAIQNVRSIRSYFGTAARQASHEEC